MDITTQKVLRQICISSNGLQFFQLHRKLYLSPLDLSKALATLLNEGLVELGDSSAKATLKGQEFAQKRGKIRQTENSTAPWLKIPSEFVASRSPINEPYAPSARFFVRSKQK